MKLKVDAIASLRKKSPETVTAIEIAPAKLNYAQAVETVKMEGECLGSKSELLFGV